MKEAKQDKTGRTSGYVEWDSPYNPFNSSKVLLWRSHLEAIARGEFLPPVSADIDPSNYCNLDCSWCIQGKYRKSNENTVPKDLLLKLARFLGKWGTKGVCIGGGGEPLTNPAVPDLIRELVSSGVEASLITNGTLLTKPVREALADCARFCGVSVDAGNAEDWIKEKKAKRELFSQLLENIEELAKLRDSRGSRLTIGYKMVIHPANYSGILQAAKLAKSIGANDFHVRPAYLPDPTVFTTLITETVKEQITEARTLQDETFRVYGITHKFTPEWRKKLNFTRCLATPLTATFGADRRVHICCDRRGQKGMVLCSYDNLETVMTAWNSREHHELVDAIRIGECPRCTFAAYNEIMEKVILSDSMYMNFI
jgi:sulfatase maturation enzyme AslB (radical SAM superfamily)